MSPYAYTARPRRSLMGAAIAALVVLVGKVADSAAGDAVAGLLMIVAFLALWIGTSAAPAP